MKKNKVLLFLILCVAKFGYTQEVYPNIILGYSAKKEISFYQYVPVLKIKADYKSIKEAENKYPEQLVQSILSASSQNWVDYNTLGGASKSRKKEVSHFQRVLSMDKEKNYFELHHKIVFNIGNVPTAIIKLFIYQETQEPISAAFVMQFVDNRWQKTSHPATSDLSIIVMRLKSNVLRGLILGSSDKNIKELRKRVSTNGLLDTEKLINEFSNWYSPQRDETKITLFIDPKTW